MHLQIDIPKIYKRKKFQNWTSPYKKLAGYGLKGDELICGLV
jgi:hypothetical protein